MMSQCIRAIYPALNRDQASVLHVKKVSKIKYLYSLPILDFALHNVWQGTH